MSEISIEPTARDGLEWAQKMVTEHHYLHAPVDPRCRPLAYLVRLEPSMESVGCLIFGRPEATRCFTGKLTYGSFDDVQAGRAQYDRWEILNLARVWLSPRIQKGGADYVPHAASLVIRESLKRVSFEYLKYAPPVDCSYPYQIRCVLSYCDTRIHTGWIYMASRFKLARMNERGIQTYMKPIPALTEKEDTRIRKMAEQSKRSQRIRALRVIETMQTSFL